MQKIFFLAWIDWDSSEIRGCRSITTQNTEKLCVPNQCYWYFSYQRESSFVSIFKHFVWFNWGYLFNGISAPYGLFNAKIWFICKGFVLFICLMAYQLFMGYLVPKFDSFVKVFFFYLFNGISTLDGLFSAEIWFICKCFVFLFL